MLPPTQPHLDPVLENNLGAARIRRGEFIPALRHFMRALTALQGEMAADIAVEQAGKQASTEEAMYLANPAPVPMCSIAEMINKEAREQPGDTRVIWTEPFTMAWNATASRSANNGDVHIAASACSVFNTALVYHLNQVPEGPRDVVAEQLKMKYTNAIELYRQCLKLLLDLPNINSQSSDIYWITYKIAILNNLGDCYARLGKLDESNVCFRDLARSLMLVLHGTPGGFHARGSSPAEMDLYSVAVFFLVNAGLDQNCTSVGEGMCAPSA